jgi:hydrophobe/amphiphile efflux-3 (HAE3) family protein
MPQWHLQHGERYAVTGAPIVVSDLTGSITRSILVLLLAGVAVMALTLALVFRRRLRLLPLGVALAAAALTFGALALAGTGLTMAAIGVLPVLLGLAVDYAIQFQARVEEEAGPGGSLGAAAPRAASRGAPTIAAAAAATAAGFLALLVSPVPMVRSFGLLLVLGILLAFALALSAGTAMLTLADRPRGDGRLAGAFRDVGESLAAAARGAADLLGLSRAGRALAPRARLVGARARGVARGALTTATRAPRRVLAVALVLAAAGWALDTQTKVESDVQKLVPQDLPALKDLRALQRSSGVGGEIDVMVQAKDLTTPSVVRWMTSYQASILRRFGYGPKRSCGKAVLCPAFSLPDLLSTSGGAAGSQASSSELRDLLDAIPAYFSEGVVTRDRTVATLAFGIRLMPLDRQQRVIETMRRALHPPSGVRAELVGLPVIAAQANRSVAATDRRFLTLLAGLLAVALVLLAVFRAARRALVPLIPIALATGWSALILFCIRIPLNPMSVTLGALVIAISTEFSVLLSERYRQEREAGHAPPDALRRTYLSTGAAVTASGVTAIAGFAVLMLSDIRMLRDFGFVTVVDLTVSLLGVTLVLPSVLVLAERGAVGELVARTRGGFRRVRLRPRRARAA